MTREASGLSERLGCTQCPFEGFVPTTALYLEASHTKLARGRNVTNRIVTNHDAGARGDVKELGASQEHFGPWFPMAGVFGCNDRRDMRQQARGGKLTKLLLPISVSQNDFRDTC